MMYSELSKKQTTAMLWWSMPAYRDMDALVCDGSIRSGKSLAMTVGFVLWSSSCFHGQAFAMCGKTIESMRRNVVIPMQEWLGGIATVTERRSENLLMITCNGHTNRYFLFGGKDESSYALIQGMTLAGVLFDEVALMPQSFVDQALARCSVDGARFWFNCNPELPTHWFYQSWVLGCKEKNALHLHMTMKDNLSLSDEKRMQYERMFTGAFYQRYILGIWTAAEGRIYDFYDRKQYAQPNDASRAYTSYVVSMDYGTQNPTAMLLWGLCGGVWYAFGEYYYSGRESRTQKTDEEYYADLVQLVGDRPIRYVIVDPSAASMIATIRKHGKFVVKKAKNEVLDGIRHTATALQNKKIILCDSCTRTLDELDGYVWDTKATASGEDRPTKENDHAMDAMRYFVMTVLIHGVARIGDRNLLGM